MLVVALRWLVGFWMLGCLVAGFTVLGDLVRVWQLRRRLRPCHDESIAETLTEAMRLTGLSQRPKVYLSDCVGSPCTSGVWNPILILPQSMLDQPDADSAMQLGALTHECAHIARRDVAWALLGRLVQSVYWWDPGLRRIVRELSHLREEICDNHVLRSSVDIRLYAKALVDFAAAPLARPLIGVIGMVANENPLSGRVERLLEESPDQTTRVEWSSRRGIAYIVLVACGVIGIIGASSKVAGALARVLLPAFEESEPSRQVAVSTWVESEAVPQVPYWSGESRVRRSTPTTEIRRPVAAAPAAAFSRDSTRDESFVPPPEIADSAPFVPPMEAGSGVFNPAPPSELSEPVEAGSGVGNSFTPVPVPVYEEAPVAVRPRPQATPPGAANPRPRQLNPNTRMRAITTTELINGKPVTVTRMVPYMTDEGTAPTRPVPAYEAGENEFPTAPLPPPVDLNGTPPTDEFQNKPRVQEQQFRTLELYLAEDPNLQHGDQVLVTVTHAESESTLPNRIYFEGLTYYSPKTEPTFDSPEDSPLADPNLDAAPLVAPPVPPAAVPAEEAANPDQPAPPTSNPETPATSGWFTFSGHASTIKALAYLQSRGAVTSVTKAEPPTAERTHAGIGLAPASDEPDTAMFRLSLEAVANEAGQWSGLRCWGRDLPGETPELRLAELTRILIRWKEECLNLAHVYQVQSAIHPANNHREEKLLQFAWRMKLTTTLHIFDNMRYSDVQQIIAVCESLQIQTQVIAGTQAAADVMSPLAYTFAELTLVYDKKGHKVGDHAVLLAEQAGTKGAQVIADAQFNSVLNSFSLTHPQFHSTLLLNVDPDLPMETLLSFIARANRAGFKSVELLPREELRVYVGDQLAPLLSDAPSVLQTAPIDLSAPMLNHAVPSNEGGDLIPENEIPSVQITEPLSDSPVTMFTSKPLRERRNPLPIPAETFVVEH